MSDESQSQLTGPRSEELATKLRRLEEELAQAEAQRAASECRLRDNDAEIDRLNQGLTDLRVEMARLLVENQRLQFWLNRYKAIKDKYLARGSFQERLTKWAAKKLIHRRGATPRFSGQRGKEGIVSTAHVDGIVEPPQHWLDNPLRPPIVIAILNWNRVDLLRKCLESLFLYTDYERLSICVYDQGSTDGSREYLQSLGGRVDAVFGKENLGFITANNLIIERYAKWDAIFLNNDTQVTERWLEPLLETSYKSEKIGVVGPKLVYLHGLLQEAGSQVFQDGSCRAYGKYENPNSPEFNQLREVDYSSAACLYVKRRVLDLIGGFDETYSPAYYEDADFAFKARNAGFKVLYEPRSTVMHREYSSSGQSAVGLMEVNRLKFVNRWKAALQGQQRNFWEARDLEQQEKVLVISSLVPAPDRSSGGTRLYEFIRLLTRHYHVVFAYLGSEASRDYLRPLERAGVTVFYPGFAKAVHNYEVDVHAILKSNHFKIVFCELIDVAEQFLDAIREHSPHSLVVVDTYDVHFIREMREAAIARDHSLKRKAERTKRRELEIYGRADLVLTVTEEDRRALLSESRKVNVAIVPNIHVLPEVVAPRSSRRDLVFVGGFTHRPNVDAVLYFCREILPLVQEQIASVRLYIVGNAPPAEVVALGSESVIVTGYVANMVSYLNSALVSVIPLRFGSGMKGKIGEAMAYGLPSVTTSIGAEGMGLVDGVDALIADRPEEFAARIVLLHRDAEMWSSIADKARLHVAREWSPEAVNRELSDILAKYCSASRFECGSVK